MSAENGKWNGKSLQLLRGCCNFKLARNDSRNVPECAADGGSTFITPAGWQRQKIKLQTGWQGAWSAHLLTCSPGLAKLHKNCFHVAGNKKSFPATCSEGRRTQDYRGLTELLGVKFFNFNGHLKGCRQMLVGPA